MDNEDRAKMLNLVAMEMNVCNSPVHVIGVLAGACLSVGENIGSDGEGKLLGEHLANVAIKAIRELGVELHV